MKAQLVKREDRWDLYNEDGHKIASTLDGAGNKLSFKNYQAIERGYDLDELATKICGNTIYDFEKHDFFRQGFQEALELMGDKKFSEEDIRKALSAGLSIGYGRQFEIENKQVEIDSYMESLQQTEWEVTYNPEELDADGCLILKRINL